MSDLTSPEHQLESEQQQTQENKPPESTSPQMSEEDMIAQLDPTRKAREEAIRKIEAVLHSVDKGHSLNQKKLMKLCTAIHSICFYQEQLLRGLYADMIRAATRIMNSEKSSLGLAAQVQAITYLLADKNLISAEELDKMKKERVLSEMLAELQKGQAEVVADSSNIVEGTETKPFVCKSPECKDRPPTTECPVCQDETSLPLPE